MKTIELPHGITLSIDKVNRRRTAITCSEMKSCPGCENSFCYFDCDGSHTIDESLAESEDEARDRIETNCHIEGVLSLIQHLYALGFDHLVEEMKPAIESTMNEILEDHNELQSSISKIRRTRLE